MSTVIAIPSVIDPAIQKHPELVAAIGEAMDFLPTQLGEVGPPIEVSWKFADKGGTLIELAMTDFYREERFTVRRNMKTRWLLDSVNRELSVLGVWGAVLAERSRRNSIRINKLMHEMRTEESDGGEVEH